MLSCPKGQPSVLTPGVVVVARVGRSRGGRGRSLGRSVVRVLRGRSGVFVRVEALRRVAGDGLRPRLLGYFLLVVHDVEERVKLSTLDEVRVVRLERLLLSGIEARRTESCRKRLALRGVL